METALELTRLLSTLMVPAAAGLAGVTLGAWLAGKRERFIFRRDTYVRLLETLIELRRAGTDIQELFQSLPRDAEGLARHRQILERREKAFEKFSGVLAATFIVLGPEVGEIINRLQDTRVHGGDEQIAAIDRALDRLSSIARRELKL